MSHKSLAKRAEHIPAMWNDFFKPLNDLFETDNFLPKQMTTPAVNVAERPDSYELSVGAPGLNKDDFNIDVEGNMLTISCEKEENKEEKDKGYTRKEYSYSSFSRSFTLPDEVLQEKIEASYQNGVLLVKLPKKEDARKALISKHIAVK